MESHLIELCLHLEEDDHEGEERKRLDEGKTKNQEDEDSGASAGVACQGFGCRSCGLALTKSAETCCQSHAQTSSERNPLGCR